MVQSRPHGDRLKQINTLGACDMTMAPPRRAELRSPGTIRWEEMRCVRCRHLLQKVERDALCVGKCLEIKCPHCKVINYLVGMSADTFGERQQAVWPAGNN